MMDKEKKTKNENSKEAAMEDTTLCTRSSTRISLRKSLVRTNKFGPSNLKSEQDAKVEVVEQKGNLSTKRKIEELSDTKSCNRDNPTLACSILEKPCKIKTQESIGSEHIDIGDAALTSDTSQNEDSKMSNLEAENNFTPKTRRTLLTRTSKLENSNLKCAADANEEEVKKRKSVKRKIEQVSLSTDSLESCDDSDKHSLACKMIEKSDEVMMEESTSVRDAVLTCDTVQKSDIAKAEDPVMLPNLESSEEKCEEPGFKGQEEHRELKLPMQIRTRKLEVLLSKCDADINRGEAKKGTSVKRKINDCSSKIKICKNSEKLSTPDEIKIDEKSDKIKIDEKSDEIKIDEKSDEIKIDEKSDEIKIDEKSDEIKIDEKSDEIKIDEKSDEIKIDEKSDEIKIDEKSDEIKIDEKSDEIKIDEKSDEIKIDEKSDEIKIDEKSDEIKIDEKSDEIKIDEKSDEIKIDEKSDEIKIDEKSDEIKIDEKSNEIKIENSAAASENFDTKIKLTNNTVLKDNTDNNTIETPNLDIKKGKYMKSAEKELNDDIEDILGINDTDYMNELIFEGESTGDTTDSDDDSNDITETIDINDADLDLNSILLNISEKDAVNSKKLKNLPGISYIIFFSGSEQKNVLTFDCVLCNPSIGRILSGRTLTKHFRTRSHLLNILKLHNYSVFEKCKDSSVTITEFLTTASECENVTEKQIIFVTAKSYREERKTIASTILKLNNQSKSIHDDLAPASKKTEEQGHVDDEDDDDLKDVEDELKALEDELMKDVDEELDDDNGGHKSESDDDDCDDVVILEESIPSSINSLNFKLQVIAKELIGKHMNRHPKQIVFITDRSDIFAPKQFQGPVKILTIPNLSFASLFSKIMKYKIIGKGSLFIISCGIFSLLNAKNVGICQRESCSNPLMKYTVDRKVTTDYLKLKAMKLQEYILDYTPDDQVVFCDIIPINISKGLIQKCDRKHTLRHDTPRETYTKYLEAIYDYNKFVDIHCNFFGFKNLNLLNILFPEDGKSGRSYEYGKVNNEQLSKTLNDRIHEYLKNMKVKVDTIPKVLSLNSATNSRSIEEGLKPSYTLFDKIVIITNSQYLSYVENLCGPRVEVIVSDEKTAESEKNKINTTSLTDPSIISAAIEKHKHYQPSKTLWLSPVGIFTIARRTDSALCLQSDMPCSSPLSVIVPDDNITGDSRDFIKDATETMDTVNSKLNDGSVFLMLPPVPPKFLTIETENHEKYHELGLGQCYFTTSLSLDHLKELYTRMSQDILSAVRSQLTEKNILNDPFDIYELFTRRWKNHLELVKLESFISGKSEISGKFDAWFAALNSFISACLGEEFAAPSLLGSLEEQNDKSKLEKNQDINTLFSHLKSYLSKYDHIVIVGCHEHLQMIQDLNLSMENLSLVNLNYGDKWETNWEVDSLKSLPNIKTILFMFIPNIKMFAKEVCVPQCIDQKCKHPVTYLSANQTKMTEIISKIKKLHCFLNVFISQFSQQSRLVLLPVLTSTFSSIVSPVNEADHKNLHNLLTDRYLITGHINELMKTVKNFKEIWTQNVKELLIHPYDVFNNVLKSFAYLNRRPVTMVTLNERGPDHNLQNMKFLKAWMHKPLRDLSAPSHTASTSVEEITDSKMFDKIIILTTKEFAVFIEKFSGKKVQVIDVGSGSVDELAVAIRDRQKFSWARKTLWLTHIEVFITKSERSSICSTCAEPLDILAPSLLESATVSSFIMEIETKMKDLIDRVDSFLGVDSYFAILPPFPLTFLVLDKQKHNLYHKIDERKFYYFTSRESLKLFELLYAERRKQIINLVLHKFEKLNIKTFITDYAEFVDKCSSFVDVITYKTAVNSEGVTSINFEQWCEHMESLFSQIFDLPEMEIPRSHIKKSVHARLSFETSETSLNLPKSEGEEIDKMSKNVVSATPAEPVFKLQTEKPKSQESLQESTKTSVKKSENYDHIVILCFHRQHLQLLREATADLKSVTVSNLHNLTFSADKMNILVPSDSQMTLFIIVGSVNLLGDMVPDSLCDVANCENQLAYLDTAETNSKDIVRVTRTKLRTFRTKLQKHFKGKSHIVLTSMYTRCASKFYPPSELHHQKEHEIMQTYKPFILQGDRDMWSQIAKDFQNSWDNEMFIQFKLQLKEETVFRLKNIAREFKASVPIFIYWIDLEAVTGGAIEATYNKQCKLYIKKLLNVMCSSIELDDQIRSKSSDVLERLGPVVSSTGTTQALEGDISRSKLSNVCERLGPIVNSEVVRLDLEEKSQLSKPSTLCERLGPAVSSTGEKNILKGTATESYAQSVPHTNLNQPHSNTKIVRSIPVESKQYAPASVRQSAPISSMGSAPTSSVGRSTQTSNMGRSAPTSSVGRSAPISSVGRSAPTSSVGRSAPISSVGRSTPTSSVGRSAPSSSVGRSAPTASMARSAPTSSMGRSTPTASVGRSAPASSVGRSAPASSVGRSAPTSSVGRSAPVSSAGRSVPISSVERLALSSNLGRSIPLANVGRSNPTVVSQRLVPTTSAGRSAPVASTGRSASNLSMTQSASNASIRRSAPNTSTERYAPHTSVTPASNISMGRSALNSSAGRSDSYTNIGRSDPYTSTGRSDPYTSIGRSSNTSMEQSRPNASTGRSESNTKGRVASNASMSTGRSDPYASMGSSYDNIRRSDPYDNIGRLSDVNMGRSSNASKGQSSSNVSIARSDSYANMGGSSNANMERSSNSSMGRPDPYASMGRSTQNSHDTQRNSNVISYDHRSKPETDRNRSHSNKNEFSSLLRTDLDYSDIQGHSSAKYNQDEMFSKPAPTTYSVSTSENTTAEKFYDKDWMDVVTFGSQTSFHYLMGALRGLRKLLPYKRGKVLYLNCSDTIISIIRARVEGSLKASGEEAFFGVVLLNHKPVTADIYDCFLTTPSTLTNFHWDILCRKDITAVIVDDTTNIMDDMQKKITLTSIFRRMNLKENPAINKVFVSEFYQVDLRERLTSEFGIPLKEIKADDFKSGNTSSLITTHHGQNDQNRRVDPPHHRTLSHVSGGGDYITASKTIDSLYPAGSSRTTNRYVGDSSHTSYKYPSVGNSEGTSRYQAGSGPSTHLAGSGEVDSGYRKDRGYIGSQVSSYSASASSSTIGHPITSITSGPRTSSQVGPKDSQYSSRFPDRSESSYQRASSPFSHTTQRREPLLSVQHKRPRSGSMDRNYESSRSGNKRFRSRSKDHYRSDLKDTRFPAHRSGSSVEYLSTRRDKSPTSAVVDFTVEGALDILQRISNKVGVLGPVMMCLTKSVRSELEVNRIKAINIIKEEENVVLIEMVVGKLRELLHSAPLKEISFISKAIEWITHLVGYAKSCPEDAEIEIDLRAIAQASLNKTPDFTISLIKTAFAYEGKEDPTPDDINKAYLKVCSLHCQSMMEN